MKWLLFLLLTTTLIAYEKPPTVPQDVWDQVFPYLLPEDHPIKPKLDKLFSKKRYTQDLGTLLQGNFDFKVREKKDQIIVAKHEKLKGIILKLYTDSQKHVPDWPMWIKRIQGAEATQATIDSLNASAYFKVPHKWIYPLPGDGPKHFILIVENMHVCSATKNERIWSNPLTMSHERLRLLYLILQQTGLSDSVYIDNVPFCSDGRQAFIDTEHYHRWPVHLEKLIGRIPKKNRAYWRDLITFGVK